MDWNNPLSVFNATSTAAQPSSGQAGVLGTTPAQNAQFSAMQALMLQQYHQQLVQQRTIQAQQLAAKAATLKSAKEMAAARAAEISKQLKGGDAGDDEEKPAEKSKSRSRSKSASQSPSRPLRSKSRSRSPIRYRRGRSGSRSPIRYRREYYSPPRARDYYSHRYRGYRNYYRGNHFDYRRGRDRDYHYRRRSRSRGTRRSQSKSKSPSSRRRRSRTLSPSLRQRRSHSKSPRHRREESIPSKRKREEKRSHQTAERSVSREVSANCTSRSTSPGSRSPSISGVGGNQKLIEEEAPFRWEEKEKGAYLREERSPSDFSKGSDRVGEESPAKKWSTLNQKSCSVLLAKELVNNTTVIMDREVDAKQLSPDADHGQPKRSSDFFGKQRRLRKTVNIFSGSPDKGSESDGVLDDWRDDLMSGSKEKVPTRKKVEPDMQSDKGQTDMHRHGLDSSADQLGHMMSKLNDSSHDRVGDSMVKGLLQQQGPLPVAEEISLMVNCEVEEGNLTDVRHTAMNVIEDIGVIMGDAEDNEVGRVSLEGAVFEGPKPASEDVNEGDQYPDRTDKEHDGYGNKAASIDEIEISQSRDGKEQKDESGKLEKRRDRHRRHKKKRKIEILDEENNEDPDGTKDDDTHRARKRHRRKHRREGEHAHKDKKKRKHKHKTKSHSISADHVDEDEAESADDYRIGKKKSVKHHKRTKHDVSKSQSPSAGTSGG